MAEALPQRNMRVTPPYTPLNLNEVGGAVVRRAFGGLRSGTVLSLEQIKEMRPGNLKSLVNLGNLQLFPKVAGKRFMRKNDEGLYDVIEGHQINDAPMSRDEAKALMRAGKH